ncbi:phage tail sheath family protein [Nocardioides limicola]|uniref:phage tail sheath family protein n=1 Tax=Nocardioides limicola TaxID=2803368 RepID=UPI00193C0351|nr:phage tail sheath family protein [Nocardioides sp. DJM-14]
MPGHYIEEIAAPLRIEPAVSQVAFVGRARRGPRLQPIQVRGLSDFDATFGSADTPLRRAVAAYVGQGGDALLVVRATDVGPALEALAEAAVTLLVIAPQLLRGHEADVHAWCLAHRCVLLSHHAAGTIAPGLGENAAVYAPGLRDPDGRPVWTSAAVAGVVRRTDLSRGIWKAPSGPDATVLGLTADPPPPQHSRLNLVRTFHAGPPIIWGSRTAAPEGHDWKYLSLRRCHLWLLDSITNGLRWTVFEPHGEHLWARARGLVEDFLDGLWREGALVGSRPDHAYFVRCDRTTMTQADIDQGRLIVLIGVAFMKPGEFVVSRVTTQTLR